MGKIGDLFVRLGLKSDGFKKGMKEAKKETQSFGSKLSSMKAGALAVWAAVGTAVMAFVKDFVSSTNKMSDAWERNMRGIKNAWQVVKGALTDFDFKNFGKNIADAFKAGREAADAKDLEYELLQSVRIQKAAIQQELNELHVMMRDTTLSPADRQAAAERYKALLQPIADAEIEVYKKILSTSIKEWQAGTNLNRTEAEILEFFHNIGTNAEAMMAKFPDIYSVFNNKKGDKTNQTVFDAIFGFLEASNQTSEIDKLLSRTTNSIKAEIKRQRDAIANEVETYGKEDLDLDIDVDLNLELDKAEIEAEMAAVDEYIKNFADSWNEECLKIRDMNLMLEDSMINSFSSGMQALTDFMLGVENASAEQVLAAFIQPLADTMKQMGEMFMAEGLAMVAFKDSIKNPTALIAAGAALIAVSSLVSSGLAKLTGNPSGGTAASTGAGSTGASAGGIETYEQEITVHVVGEISGDKIVLAGQKTLNKWSR